MPASVKDRRVGAKSMRVLFVSNYYPPEVNAPATRLHEHACQWAEDGHEIEVLTSVPNFPEGEVYEGYRNRFSYERKSGIDVTRVPMYVTRNEGMLKRSLSYASFMLSSIFYSRRIRSRPDVVVATSPQFFSAVGGLIISRFLKVPFVMEVRDLWPESIIAVGAARRGLIIRMLERLEHYLYSQSDHIVVVTDAFKRFIEGKGIDPRKISVLKNGADLQAFAEPLDSDLLQEWRRKLDLEDKFVASYIGTIGMAHRADVMLEAAQRCSDPRIVFMVVGTGAERQKLEERAAALNLSNFRLVDKQPKHVVRHLLALSDAAVVHLRASVLFQSVIPSKIFEAMAMRLPIVLGVEGETRDIIEEAGAGIPIRPEDAGALASAVQSLHDDHALCERMGRHGSEYVHERHDRKKLARRFWQMLHSVSQTKSGVPSLKLEKLPSTNGKSNEVTHIDAEVA